MSRIKTSDLVAGMGTGMDILHHLLQEIRRQGGDPETLALLSRPRWAKNLKQVVEVLLACDWRVPANRVRELAEKIYRKENYADTGFVGHARHLYWSGALVELGIPYKKFSNSPAIGPKYGDPPIPITILELLDGKVVEYPLLVEEWVVTDLHTVDGTQFLAGSTINASHLQSLVLVHKKYFDFDN